MSKYNILATICYQGTWENSEFFVFRIRGSFKTYVNSNKEEEVNLSEFLKPTVSTLKEEAKKYFKG